jgi:hypothetical protein
MIVRLDQSTKLSSLLLTGNAAHSRDVCAAVIFLSPPPQSGRPIVTHSVPCRYAARGL